MQHLATFWKHQLWPYRGWLFPLCVVGIVLVLSLLRISGSSVGVYDNWFGNPTSNTLSGQPRTVRSDEWMVTTPLTVAQYTERFTPVNRDIGAGQDMSLVVDVPYADWSSLFKPQNAAFFVLPLDMAFAFKWWFLAAMLCLAVYGFVLLLAPQQYLAAALLSVGFLFSPFIQWWYQSITLLPIAYGLIMLIAALRLVQADTYRRSWPWAVLLSYTTTCFILLMYPAFQITVAICLSAVAIAYLQANHLWSRLVRKHCLALLGTALLLACCVTGLFLWQHQETIKTTLQTVYPGSRQVTSGGLSPYVLLTWPFSYLLQSDQYAGLFQTNQSESSGFLLISLVVLPGLLWQAWRDRAHRSDKGYNATTDRQTSYLLLACVVVGALFMARSFLPLGDVLYSLLGLSKVPHIRLWIGFGVLHLIILTVAVVRPSRPMSAWYRIVSLRHTPVLVLIALAYSGIAWLTIRHFGLIPPVGPYELGGLIAVLTLCTAGVLSPFQPVRLAALVLFAVYSLASTATIHPLQRGLNLTTNEFARYIQHVEPRDTGYWVANDSPQVSALLMANGAETRGGVNTYPQRQIWHALFPADEAVTNRYAHIRFMFGSAPAQPRVELIQSDSFFVKLTPCDPMVRRLGIDHIVSEQPLQADGCFQPAEQHQFGRKTLYVYHRAS